MAKHNFPTVGNLSPSKDGLFYRGSMMDKFDSFMLGYMVAILMMIIALWFYGII